MNRDIEIFSSRGEYNLWRMVNFYDKESINRDKELLVTEFYCRKWRLHVILYIERRNREAERMIVNPNLRQLFYISLPLLHSVESLNRLYEEIDINPNLMNQTTSKEVK